MKNNPPVIVIGGGINALGVVRNLGRNGIDVYCVNDKKDEVTYSKYCKKHYALSEIDNEEKLMDFLQKFRRQIKCDVVIFPTTDLSVLNVAHLMKELTGYLQVTSDYTIIETIVKKRLFYQSLKERNVSYPHTIFSDLKDFQNIRKEISFPVFVKPSVSQVFRKIFGKKGFVANSQKELDKILQQGKDIKIDLIVQEIIPGTAKNHFFIAGFYDNNSKPVAVFAFRRLRMWPLWYGGSTICVSVPISEVANMKDVIINYLNEIGFRGIFHAEFKRDPRDNIAKLIEINARSWQKNVFPSVCGVNVILTAYLEAIGINVELIDDYENGVYIIEFLLDLMTSLVMITKRQLSFREWFTPLTRKNEQTVFARDDINPFAIHLFDNITNFISKKNLSRILGKN